MDTPPGENIYCFFQCNATVWKIKPWRSLKLIFLEPLNGFFFLCSCWIFSSDTVNLQIPPLYVPFICTCSSNVSGCLCVCVAWKPGFGANSSEKDGGRAERASVRCPEETGGSSAETAPPCGGGKTQIPQRGGAHHPAAPVSLLSRR